MLIPKKTKVYDAYWRFAAERQQVFFKRLSGARQPWSNDPVIAEHKFTNAYRASDRVSQFLIRNVIYRTDLPQSPSELAFRILLFKLFNKIETWQLLEEQFGEISLKQFSFEKYDRILTNARSGSARIYSGAYIMPSGGSILGYKVKHKNHLKLLELMMKDRLGEKISRAKTFESVFKTLRSYPTIGDFLAYQFSIDINYSELTNFSENDFVMPGPGAKDGIRKCFSDLAGYSESDLIRYVTDSQEAEFERLGIQFKSLWGRSLQLIDCQNIFCETDKYARVMFPEVSGISGRTRIKQKFNPIGALPAPWYPPKWKINHLIQRKEGGASNVL